MKRKKLIIISVVITIFFAITLWFAKSEYFVKWEFNKYINISGIKLLNKLYMAEIVTRHKAERIEVWGVGDSFDFKEIGVNVEYRSDGKYPERITTISTDNPSHDVFGIHIGDSINKAISILEKQGFSLEKFDNEDKIYDFYKDDYAITFSLNDKGSIFWIQVGIIDDTAKDDPNIIY